MPLKKLFQIFVFLIVTILPKLAFGQCYTTQVERTKNTLIINAPHKNFFDEIDRLPQSTKNNYSIARVQVINHKLYFDYFINNQNLMFRVNILKDFLVKNIAKLKDFDAVFQLSDDNILLSNKAIDTQIYAGPVFTTSYKIDSNTFLSSDNHFILYPDFYVLSEDFSKKMDQAVESKAKFSNATTINKLLFRGASTGINSSLSLDNMHENSRINIALKSLEWPQYIDARLTSAVQFDPNSHSSMSVLNHLNKIFGDNWDKHFIQFKDQFRYNYILSVDGNTASWARPIYVLASRSVLFYTSEYRQWFQDLMIPNVNYIDLKPDLSDVIDKIQWALKNPAAVQNIISNANALSAACLTTSEIENYFVEVLNIYADSFDYKVSNRNFKEINPSYWCMMKRKLETFYYRVKVKINHTMQDI